MTESGQFISLTQKQESYSPNTYRKRKRTVPTISIGATAS